MYGEEGDYGPIVTVRLPGTPIDIAVTDNNHSFVEIRQLTACGINVEDYDIFVVKQGYIHPGAEGSGQAVRDVTDRRGDAAGYPAYSI